MTTVQTELERVDQEFDEAYGSFKLTKFVTKLDHDRLLNFLHDQIKEVMVGERERLKTAVSLWMESYHRSDTSFNTKDFINYLFKDELE